MLAGKSYCYICDKTVSDKGQNKISSMILDLNENHILAKIADIHLFSAHLRRKLMYLQLLSTLILRSYINFGKFNIICQRYPKENTTEYIYLEIT